LICLRRSGAAGSFITTTKQSALAVAPGTFGDYCLYGEGSSG